MTPKERVIAYLGTEECVDLACSARVPRGAGLCLAHELEARAAGRRFAIEVEQWLALRPTDNS